MPHIFGNRVYLNIKERDRFEWDLENEEYAVFLGVIAGVRPAISLEIENPFGIGDGGSSPPWRQGLKPHKPIQKTLPTYHSKLTTDSQLSTLNSQLNNWITEQLNN